LGVAFVDGLSLIAKFVSYFSGCAGNLAVDEGVRRIVVRP